jgi:hypothetical protein
MASFAQRMGLRSTRSLVQRDSLDEDTRTELWNLTLGLMEELRDAQLYESETVLESVTSALWAWEFKKPRDEQPNSAKVWGMVKNYLLKADWADSLDLIEAIVGYAKRYEEWTTTDVVPGFVESCNLCFESYLVAYRFVSLRLLPIDSEVDLSAINLALDEAAPFRGARHHLEQAAALLADRKKPDNANSIKESISAVEAVCKEVTGEGTLGGALKKLKGAGVNIHPALEQAWLKMYGWTSDEDGIRHGGIEAADADQSLAKYMLVACSAFVAHIIETGRKAELV